jgi:hypothetical protein
VDVLNAQQQVFQTRRDLQQVRYNYLLNTLRLKAAAGQLGEADIAESIARWAVASEPLDEAFDGAAMRGDELARPGSHSRTGLFILR